MPIIKRCAQCGTIIKVSPSKNSKYNFCNRECYNKFYKSKKTKTYKCEVCGKIFESNKIDNANRFCSRECYNKNHAIKEKNRQCLTCKKYFIAKTSEDKYCCRECYDKDRHMPKGENHWNWKGGVSIQNDHRDSAEYKKWRLSVYKRDNYCCVKCGSKEKLNAHHIKSWKNYPHLRYAISNGITLCEKCHIKYHQENGYHDDKKL
jgi:hypothetical protein